MNETTICRILETCSLIGLLLGIPFSIKVKVKLSIDPSIKHVQQPLWRIAISVEKRVEEKFEEALRNNIIEKVEVPSE